MSSRSQRLLWHGMLLFRADERMRELLVAKRTQFSAHLVATRGCSTSLLQS